MLRGLLRGLGAPFRLISWKIWVPGLAVAAWFARGYLMIVPMFLIFNPIVLPPLFESQPETQAEARLQDLHHFRHVRELERSLDDAGRARFDAAVERARAEVETATDAEFLLDLSRIQATIDNGHSNTSITRLVSSFPRLPIRATFMDGELRILRVLRGHEDLLGARIVQINGEDALGAAFRFRDAYGSNDARFLMVAPLFLMTPEFLNAVGLAGDETRLRLELADGTVVDRHLAALPPEEGTRRRGVSELPLPWVVESDQWVSVVPDGDPLYLRRPDNGYWMKALPEMNGAYVNLRTNFSDGTSEAIGAWARRTLDELSQLNPEVIIVDSRFNRGGDFTQTHVLMSGLGDIVGPEGRVYLLTSGRTFSAGIVNLAMAKESAPDRTLIIGEEIGDRLHFWAEGWHYTLPNSGFRARYSTGFYDLQNGCEGIFRCHWASADIFPVIVDDLDVDVPAPLTFETYAAGRDPAMEAIEVLEGERQLSTAFAD